MALELEDGPVRMWLEMTERKRNHLCACVFGWLVGWLRRRVLSFAAACAAEHFITHGATLQELLVVWNDFSFAGIGCVSLLSRA